MSRTFSYRVITTRTVDQASPFLQEVAGLAAAAQIEVEVLCTPVMQAQAQQPTGPIPTPDKPLEGYRWATFTSVNGVLGLEKFLGGGLKLPAYLAKTRIACVGTGTRAALLERGLEVDFMPSTADALHMLKEWPESPRQVEARGVLCFQGANARPTLAQGLGQMGWEVATATVYSMSRYPASYPLAEERRPGSLTLEEALPLLDQTHLLVATAPSLLRELYSSWKDGGEVGNFPPVLAIGASTAAQAESLGLEHLVSASPRAGDLARATVDFIQATASKAEGMSVAFRPDNK